MLFYSLSKIVYISKDEDWRLVPEYSGHHLLLFLHLCGQLCAWRLHSRGRNHSGKDDLNCRLCIIIQFSFCFAFLCSSLLNSIARQDIIFSYYSSVRKLILYAVQCTGSTEATGISGSRGTAAHLSQALHAVPQLYQVLRPKSTDA